MTAQAWLAAAELMLEPLADAAERLRLGIDAATVAGSNLGLPALVLAVEQEAQVADAWVKGHPCSDSSLRAKVAELVDLHRELAEAMAATIAATSAAEYERHAAHASALLSLIQTVVTSIEHP